MTRREDTPTVWVAYRTDLYGWSPIGIYSTREKAEAGLKAFRDKWSWFGTYEIHEEQVDGESLAEDRA